MGNSPATPIHSFEAESALCGSLILDPSYLPSVMEKIGPKDFFLTSPRLIYSAIITLSKEGRRIDGITVKDELLAHGELERAGGSDAVAEVMRTVPTANHALEYASTIQKFSYQRQLAGLLTSAANKAQRGEDLNGERQAILKAITQPPDPEEFKRAEPATDLLTAKIPPPDYIIEPFATIGRLTLLQGEPKGGKSCFSLLTAIAGSIGQWPCGRWQASGRPRNTVFITYEDDRSLIQERVGQYLRGMQEPLSPALLPTHLFIYCDDSAPLILLETPEGVAKLRKIIEEHKAEFVVVDTFSHLTAADENIKKEMQPVMNALNALARDLKCAIMVIHHTGKPSKDSSGKSMVYRSRGSSAIPAGFVAILDWGENASNITQCRFVDKRGNKDKFAVEYLPEGDDCVRWRLVDAEDDTGDKYKSRKTIIEAIATLIEEHPEGVGRFELGKKTKLSKNAVIANLESLKNEGSIQARQIASPNGKKWVYGPISYSWPPTTHPTKI